MNTKIKTLAVLSAAVLAGLGLASCNNSGTDVLEQAAPKVMFNYDSLTGAVDIARIVKVDSYTVNVTWQASDSRITITEKNDNLYSLSPEIPAYGAEDYKFNLTATLSYDGATTQKEWKDIVVKASTVDPSTVKSFETVSALFDSFKAGEIKLQATGTNVSVKGTVAEFTYYNGNHGGFYVTDGVKAILVYGNSLSEGINIGDVVQVQGFLTNYGDLIQFSYSDELCTTVTVLSTNDSTRLPDAVDSSVKELTDVNGATDMDKYSLRYRITATVVDDGSTSYPIKLTDSDTEKVLTVYSGGMETAPYDALKTFVGKKVSLEILYYGYCSSQYRVLFFGTADDITEVAMTDEEKLASSVDEAKNLFSSEYTEDAEITLPATSANFSEFGYTWSVEEDSEGVTIDAETGTLTITRGESQTTGKVKVVVSNGTLSEEAVISFTIAASRPVLLSVTDLYNTVKDLESGASYATTLSAVGWVSEIVTAYDASFNNITFMMTDGTTEFEVFHMVGGENLAVGDLIAVSGSVKNYNGTLEFNSGCVEVTSYVNSVSTILDLCEGLAAGAYLPGKYYITGTVKAIGTAYDPAYGNITFTLTDGTGDLTIFRMKGGEDLAVGDEVIIDAQVMHYVNSSGTTDMLETAAGSTLIAKRSVAASE